MYDTQNSPPDLAGKIISKDHHRQGWGPYEYFSLQPVCNVCNVSGSQHTW